MRLENKVALITGGNSDESSIVSGTALVADGGGLAVELTSRAFAQGSA